MYYNVLCIYNYYIYIYTVYIMMCVCAAAPAALRNFMNLLMCIKMCPTYIAVSCCV